MLVLSRHKDEKVYIGNDVVLTIVEVRGNKVRLGFEAPPHVRIDREEVRRDRGERGGPRAPASPR